MMTLTNRWYRDDDDLVRMLRLISTANVAGSEAAGLLPGDVVWGLFANLTIDPTARIRLFENEHGALRGFVWLHGGRDFMSHLDTSEPRATETFAAMIRWAEEHLGPGEPFRTEIAPLDLARSAVTAAGYRDTGEAAFQLNHQPLGDDLPAPELPPGAEVRPVRFDDPAEVAARVALHCEVWEPSRFSAEGYARLRGKPVYRPDLDLVAVTPAGDLAAYCIVWWNPEARVGEFEPVGTAAAHRRQGYGKALMREGLRRLRALGATDAVVISETNAEREPSRRLYASVGFRRVLLFEQWERRAGNPS